MANLQAPKNGGGVSYQGVYYPADKKGIITMPDDTDFSVFTDQGYVVIDNGTATAIEAS